MQGETETPQDHHTQTDPAPEPPHRTDSPLPPASSGAQSVRFCYLCGACFNNPLMARQHYRGKKHSRNAARAQLLRQLAGHLDALATTGLRGSFSCSVCAVSLNSIEQYHAHLQGSKHQTNGVRSGITAYLLLWKPVQHDRDEAGAGSCDHVDGTVQLNAIYIFKPPLIQVLFAQKSPDFVGLPSSEGGSNVVSHYQFIRPWSRGHVER
ncbi:hypothetical protein SRHO_G00180990 [Serrasalmus rhombeus]